MQDKPNILVVDDVPENLKLLVEMMSDLYYVRPVTSGKLALSVSKSMPPDLILLDINMPGMDGFETCKQLKAEEKTKDIPVIFLSANMDKDKIVTGFELGAVDYITKPFHAMEVMARVKTQVELKLSQKIIIKQNQTQQELLHILCHDLMNSVGVVQSFLSLRSYDEELTEEDSYMLTAINNAIDVITLVRQLRSIEEKKVTINLALLDLREMVELSCSMVQEKAKNKNIILRIDVDESLNIAVEKTSFVNSVLNNLLTNAIKFSQIGGEIIIAADDNTEGNSLLFSVQDFGVGMPEALANSVFDVEKQTSRPGTEGEQGTGFGMPLVKRFVESYGGEIELKTQEVSTESSESGTKLIMSLRTQLPEASVI